MAWLALRSGGEPPPPAIAGRQVTQEATAAPAAPPESPSLAEVAEIAVDSRRNDALYRIVADADVTRVKALLDEVDALGPVSYRPDIARILYIRFAVVAPEAAVDHVMARAYRTSWLTAVFRVWAHADLDAAVTRAQVLEGQARLLVTRAILELELPAWQRENIAERLDARETLASIRADEDLRGETDFAVVWRKALSVTDDTVRLQRLEEIVVAWAKEDPAAAMAAATELARQPYHDPPPSPGLLLQNRVIEIWATADTAAAVAWIADQESTRTVQSTTTSLILAVAGESATAAISALNLLPEGIVGNAQRALAGSARDMSDADVDTLVDWYASLEPETQNFLAPFLSLAMVARDTQRALDWAISLRGDAQMNAVVNIIWRIGDNDPELATRLVKTIEDEGLQRVAARSLIGTRVAEDPREALEWVESFTSEPVRLELVSMVFGQWSNADTDEAVREVLRLRDADMRDAAALRVATSLVQEERFKYFGESRVDLAEQLFDAIRSADVRRDLAKALYRYYAVTDPDPDRARHYADLMADDE